MTEKLRPIQELSPGEAGNLAYILTDIDDTLTREGRVEAAVYGALWRLKERGFEVIPVTGRPAGWCDLIIRQWPVEAVVGENGAFVYYREDGQIKTYTHPAAEQAAGPEKEDPLREIRDKLARILKAVQKEVPGARSARDQFARIYDLAIDFNEDPPRLGLEAAAKIQEVCQAWGAQAKISSIHVNAWFGDYDKLSMTKLFLTNRRGEGELKSRVFFFGDSPNDEPMFSFFPLSCGVANIRPFLPGMKNPPGFLASRSFGDGFVEGVERILQIK
ncbi:MAG: HAD-IIB family hydrolase [Spirochaetales bacterium]|jgi:HAD superfamily hydrolase (TIGR01484 family)|nr:HAD-IIB family hydrolase [Spirochaetales bacterium]